MKKTVLFWVVLMVLALFAGCQYETSAPQASQAAQHPNDEAHMEPEDDENIIQQGGLSVDVKGSSIKYIDIDTKTIDSGLGFQIDVPLKWDYEKAGGFKLIPNDDFKYWPALYATKQDGSDVIQEELLADLIDEVEHAGGLDIDAADELSINGYAAMGILYQMQETLNAEDEDTQEADQTPQQTITVEHSLFVIQHRGNLYKLHFSCLQSEAKTFYAYMDRILQGIAFQ
ncbi:MAG: hypothetical protein ACOYJC_01265 [Christensenellales bacterium]|jgi:hypothetical protein